MDIGVFTEDQRKEDGASSASRLQAGLVSDGYLPPDGIV